MRVAQGGSPIGRRILDVVEDPAVFMDTPGSIQIPRMIYQVGEPGATPGGFYTLAGTGLVQYNTLPGSHIGRQFLPNLNQNTSAMSRFGFPLSRNLLNIPPSYRRQFRFVWDTVLQRTTPLIAGVKCEIGLKDDALEMRAAGGGVILLSDSTVNGGRWTVQKRLTNGGGIVTGPDTGIAPDGTFQHFRLEYYDTLSPVLNFLINGVTVASLAGAALPVTDGVEPHNLCVTTGDSLANTNGQVDNQLMSRFFIEEL